MTSPSPTAARTSAAAAASPERCTWLVTPGATPNRFEAARNSGADVALLDLEDSVPPIGKDAARAAVLGFLAKSSQAGSTGSTVLGVRVNAPGTVHGLKDLVELAESRLCPAVLLVPKVEAARDVELVAQIMDTRVGQCQIWALVETPRAIQNLSDILRCPTLAGVLFGAADYAAAAGCKLNSGALRYPRAALTAGAAAASLPAVDSPYFGLHDLDGLRRETEEAVELGFAGKVAVHPRQLPVIQAVYQPDPRDLASARALVSAADAAEGGITTVDGQMVGPPVVAAARALTARAGDIPTPATHKETPGV